MQPINTTTGFLGSVIGTAIAYPITMTGKLLAGAALISAQKIQEEAPAIINGIGEVLFDSVILKKDPDLNKVLVTVNGMLCLGGLALLWNYGKKIYDNPVISFPISERLVPCEQKPTCEPTLVEVKLPAPPAPAPGTPPKPDPAKQFQLSTKAKKSDPNIFKKHIPGTDLDFVFDKGKFKSNTNNFFSCVGTASLCAFNILGTFSLNESAEAIGYCDAFNRTVAFIPTAIIGTLGGTLKFVNADVLNTAILPPAMLLSSLYTLSKVNGIWYEKGKGLNLSTVRNDVIKLGLTAYLAGTGCAMLYNKAPGIW